MSQHETKWRTTKLQTLISRLHASLWTRLIETGKRFEKSLFLAREFLVFMKNVLKTYAIK
jgi:hypothetical protein